MRLILLLLLVSCTSPLPVTEAPAPPVSEVPWCFGATIAWKQKTKEGPLKDISVESRSCFSEKNTCIKASKLASTYARLAEITNVTECKNTK